MKICDLDIEDAAWNHGLRNIEYATLNHGLINIKNSLLKHGLRNIEDTFFFILNRGLRNVDEKVLVLVFLVRKKNPALKSWSYDI